MIKGCPETDGLFIEKIVGLIFEIFLFETILVVE